MSDDSYKVITFDQLSKEMQNNPRFNNVHDLHGEEYSAEVTKADSIIIKQQPWFWHKIIPLDTTTLFAGFGNSGKSQLLLFLAAHVSNGKAFRAAGAAHQLPQGNVIILSGEDDYQYQLAPRLIASKANLSKIYLLKMMKTPEQPKALLDLDAHLVLLEQTITKIKEASSEAVRLIIVDPVQYFTGEMKDHINANVCRFISSLNDLAKTHNLSIIMNKHLRKKGAGDGVSSAVDSVSGSGAWTTSPRSCWLIQRHPTKEGVILFADLKGNLKAKDTKSMAYKIDSYLLENEKIETTAMQWLENMEDLGADEALNTVSHSPIEKAIRQWIIDFLLNCNKNPTNGAMFNSSELGKEALAAGFTRAYYFKVRAKMLEEGSLLEKAEGTARKTIMIVLTDPDLYS